MPEVRFSRPFEGLYSPQLARSVELHFELWEADEDAIRIDLPGDFLDRSVWRNGDGFAYAALSGEDCLLFQVLHAFKHILRNWCRLAVFLEIARFMSLRSADAPFWDGYCSRIEPIRWAPEASWVVCGMAKRLFGTGLPPAIEDRLRTRLTPALDLWMDTYGRRSAMANFNRDKCSLFLHREFVDNASAWTRIRRRRLFPVQRPHRPPAIVFQRGFSRPGRLWMETFHALRRAKFHALAGLRYACEYPRWSLLRRARLA
jgi:hypothetical protein